MASAYKYRWTRKDGTRKELWRAQWVGADGRQHQKRGFDRQTDALAYAQDREVEGRHGVTLEGERPSGRMTLAAWAKQWQATNEVRESTEEAYRYVVKRIVDSLGERSLSSLRPSELKSWRRGLTKRYAQSTADQTAAVLAMILRAAVQDGLIEKSPMPAVKGGSTSRVVDPDELLTIEQVRAWDAALPAHARGMAVVAATTGLRQGELLGLQVGDVDFLRGTIRVVRQLSNPKQAGVPVYAPPKTEAGVRTVPLPDVASEALAAYLAAYPPKDGEPIFRGSVGQRWRRSTFRDCWAPARERAGLPEWAHWHALRDVCASSLIFAGVDVRTVMGILGHASAEETLRTYARLWPAAQDVSRKALNVLWSEASERHGNATET